MNGVHHTASVTRIVSGLRTRLRLLFVDES